MVLSVARLGVMRWIVGLALLVGCLNGSMAQETWGRYSNSEWGYQVDYPRSLFPTEYPEPDKGGAAFESRDRRARLLMFAGSERDLGDPNAVADYLSSLEDIHRVTYRRVTSRWIVLSGYISDSGIVPGDIFYERMAFSRDGRAVSGFRLEYPPSQRSIYDHLIARIGRSLTPPEGDFPVAQPDDISIDHRQWCESQYKTYDRASDSFIRFDGVRMPCLNPKTSP
jgi:hypothetical protein